MVVVFNFTLNSSKEEPKTSAPLMQGEKRKLTLRDSKSPVPKNSRYKWYTLAHTTYRNGVTFSPLHFCQTANPNHLPAQIQPNLLDWQKTTVMLAYYKTLFNSTDSNIQFQNCHPSNPNYSWFSKEKSISWCLLWRCCSNSRRCSLSQPTTQVLMDSDVSRIAFIAWQWTISSSIHTPPSLPASVALNEMSHRARWWHVWRFKEPEHTEQSCLSQSCNPQELQQCSWQDREQCMAAALPQRAMCFSGACLCAK